MKKLVPIIALILLASATRAQKLDSIYFNLYTDSLKKGTFNYINVEGKYSDGRYLPLSSKDIKFQASAGKFDRNSLFIDTSFKDEKVKVTATSVSNPQLKQEIDIYIKKYDADERLPTMSEVLGNGSGRKRTKRKG